MNQITLQSKRCVIAGLFSAKDKAYLSKIDQLSNQTKDSGGLLVGKIIQRRGASRSNKPGGSKLMDQPLDSKYIFTKGKIEELKAMIASEKADTIIIFNTLTKNQKESLHRVLDTTVYSYMDDFHSSPIINN